MKILYLTIDRSNMVVTHFEGWHKDIAEAADVDFIRKPIQGYTAGRWAKLVMTGELQCEEVILPFLEKTGKTYDWIVTDSNFGFINERWNDIKIPKAMIIEDVHPGNSTLQMEWAMKQKWDILFYRYKQGFHTYQNEYLDKFDCRWLPHSVDTDMFKDYKQPKSRDVIMIGWHFEEHYPYRQRAFEILKDKEYFTDIQRPNEDVNGTKDWPINTDFAMVLNESKITITGGLKHNYPVMKFLEIPACKSLLFSNYFADLKGMGFKPDVNMIEMNLDDLESQTEKLLADDDFRNEITNNGYNFVRENHTGQTRAKQLLEELNG